MHALRMSLVCLVMLVANLLCAGAASSAAPPVKGQAPGYYRMMLGNFEITALNDGTLGLDVQKLLTNTTPVRVDQLLDGSGELMPGINAVSTYGHTKGHTMYVVESKGQKMAVLGDLMHVAAVQF